MGNLHQSTERLRAALDRLERAVGHGPAADGNRDLRAALESARRENAELQQVARTVADRLDGTIARLSAGQRGQRIS